MLTLKPDRGKFNLEFLSLLIWSYGSSFLCMIRAFLVSIAVLGVVLALVFDQAWLYAGAALALAGVLGDLARQFWFAYRQEAAPSDAAGTASPDAAEEDFGVMEVRPQPDAESTETDRTDPVESQEPGPAARAAAEADQDGEAQTDWRERVAADGEPSSAEASPESSPVYSDQRPVLAPLLESLRASIGAQSVCVLVQEEVVLEYRIDALASVQPDVQHEGTFETRDPLLTATMTQQSVTVRSLGEEERRDLGYYGTVPAITQAAMAPIHRPETSDTVFLVADATSEVDLGGSEARSLIEHFADTVALLLDADEGQSGRGLLNESETETEPDDVEETERAAATAQVSEEDAEEASFPDDEPRPRREIIAEEMEAADATSDELALVLVHLNRAESIARQGEDAVASAEQHLQSRLEDLAPGRRVERFGELTYGVFVRSGMDEIEGLAADLQDRMAQESGRLEGGVSVGVAVRDVRHDAEGFRADATDALLEAYETGTCTIIA